MDYQTLYLVLFTTLLIQTLALLLSWRQNREEIGLRDWGLSAALMTAGSLLVMSGLFVAGDTGDRPTPPLAELLRDAGTGLAAAGWLLAWLGIRHFFHRPTVGYWAIVAGGLLITLLLLTLQLLPDGHLPGWRVALIGLHIGGCSALIVWELQRDRAERSLVVHLASLAMTVVMLAWLARGAAAIADPLRADGTRLIDQLCIYASIVMSVTFTLSLILMTNQRIHQRLREQAAIDPLTGALNRRAFFEASRPLFGSLRRSATPLAVCVLDLDDFKGVNDNHGHAAGDQVLVAFSELTQAALREGDLFARFGGEEFVILFQQGSAEHASMAIERLRQAWSERATLDHGGRLAVTFSAGISHTHGPAPVALETLLKAADDALYQAKSSGRNRSVIWDAADAAPSAAEPAPEASRPSRPPG